MQIISKFNFATNIAVISGHPKFDKIAARLIQSLKSASKDSVKFIGVIGDDYKHLLDESYASSSVLDHEEIVVNRNYNEVIQESYLTPFRTVTHFKNAKLLKQLKSKNFYDNILGNKTPAIITVGNYSLMNRLYENINQQYSGSQVIKPLRLGFDLSIAHRSVGNEQNLDYLYYYLPKQPQNLSRYVFPSLCIGYEGLFRAFQYLQKYRTDSSNDSFLMKDFSYEISQIINKARSQFRTSQGISQDTYLTLLAAGNTQKQIKFSFRAFKDAINNFSVRDNIKGIDPQFFKFIITLPQNQKIASLIRSHATSLPSQYQISFVEQKDKYAAMCASDFAILHNGEVTVEAAACQLPATVISSMSNYKAYLTYLYNGHDSALNISTNYEGYQDLLGSLTVIGQKMGTLMLDHFERPKLRFYYVKLYRQQIQKMLMLNGRNPELRVSKTGVQWAAEDILEKIELYNNLTVENKMRGYERKQKLNCI